MPLRFLSLVGDRKASLLDMVGKQNFFPQAGLCGNSHQNLILKFCLFSGIDFAVKWKRGRVACRRNITTKGEFKMITVNSKLQTIINRIDAIENVSQRTLDTLEVDNGTAFVTVRKSKIKLLRFLLRKRSTIETIYNELVLPVPTEQELTELVGSIQPFDLKIFESALVSETYNNAFRVMRLSAMQFLAGHGKCQAGWYRLFDRFPLTSCMVDKPSGSLDRLPRNCDNILGLYDAINTNESWCWVRGVKYQVKVRAISGYVANSPKIELDPAGNPTAKLDMFRSLVWELTPIGGEGDTLRLLDKVYQTNSNILGDVKDYLAKHHAITHTREHNHLTCGDEGESVSFCPTGSGRTICETEIHVSDYGIDQYYPYVDSFKYVEESSRSIILSLSPTEDTSHLAESTHGGIQDFSGVGCRCENCGGGVHPDDTIYSERLGQSLCDGCYCDMIVNCDSCSTEMAIGNDTIYRLPDSTYSCDCCTEEI